MIYICCNLDDKDFINQFQFKPFSGYVQRVLDKVQLQNLQFLIGVFNVYYYSKVFSAVYKSEMDCVFVCPLALDQREDNLAQDAWQITG